MSIKIKINGKNLVPCKKCSMFFKSLGKKQKKIICGHCLQN
jgi:hypothetical protein